MSRRGPSHSGPFGLACTNCFKSKSKCVARPGAQGESCARCYRLGKGCHPSDSIRHRALEKKQKPSVRIAELENKVEDLLLFLHAREGADAEPDISREGLKGAEGEFRSFRKIPSTSQEIHLPFEKSHSPHRPERSGSYNDRPGNEESHRAPAALLGEMTKEHLLTRFRSHMLPHAPFLHLRPETTAEQLCGKRPFLFTAIACVASLSAQEKTAREKQLKRILFDATIGDAEHSHYSKVDLLLGILVYVGWGWEHVLHRRSASQLMLQAISIACEMRSNRPFCEIRRAMNRFASELPLNFDDETALSSESFLELQRAILGCFLLSSVVSSYFGQIDALRWTVREEEALASISLSTTCAADAEFAAQIRLQVLTEKAAQVRREQETSKGQTLSEATTLPALLSVTSLRQNLQEYQSTLCRRLSNQTRMVAHFHSTHLDMNEAEHIIGSSVPIMITQFERMTSDGSFHSDPCLRKNSSTFHEHTVRLWQCVRSSTGCISALLARPTLDFSGVSLVQWAQLVRSVVILDYLANRIDDPTWDRAAIREHIGLPSIIDQCITKLGLVSRQLGESGTDGIFTQLAQTMREFHNEMADEGEIERRSHGEIDTDWTRSVVHGGAGGATPMGVTQLASIAKDTSWLGSHITR